jgi:hypothetical protein
MGPTRIGNYVHDNMFLQDETYQKYAFYCESPTAGWGINNVFSRNHCVPNGAIGRSLHYYGNLADFRITDNIGINPVGYFAGFPPGWAAPAVPSSTVAYTNNFGFPCGVDIIGGTVTVVAVDGQARPGTSGTYYVPARKTITLTYSSAPTWKWFGY